MPQSAAGVGQKRVHLAALGRRVQFLHAFTTSEIRLHGVHLAAILPQRGGGIGDLRLVHRDQDIEAVIQAFARQREADAGAPVTMAKGRVFEFMAYTSIIAVVRAATSP